MKLFWVSFFLTFLEMALDWDRTVEGVSTTFILISTAIMCSIQIWLYLKIARGRNWARITWLVLFAISLVATLPSIPELARSAPLYTTVLAIDADSPVRVLSRFSRTDCFSRVLSPEIQQSRPAPRGFALREGRAGARPCRLTPRHDRRPKPSAL